MIDLKNHGDLLKVTVSGVFDFDKAREMLRQSREQFKLHHGLNKVNIHMDKVTSCSTCAIGAMMMLAEQSPVGFKIHLSDCHSGVHQLFDSGILDNYLHINERSSEKTAGNACANCFSTGCKTPTPSCKNI